MHHDLTRYKRVPNLILCSENKGLLERCSVHLFAYCPQLLFCSVTGHSLQRNYIATPEILIIWPLTGEAYQPNTEENLLNFMY